MRFLYLLIGSWALLTVVGCQDDEPTSEPALTAMLRQLEDPTTLRNDLARGRLSGSCEQLLLVDSRTTPARRTTLAIHPKSRRVQWGEWRATQRIRNLTLGQHHRYELYYHPDGRIDSVVYSRPGRGDEGRQRLPVPLRKRAAAQRTSRRNVPSLPRVVLLLPARRTGGSHVYQLEAPAVVLPHVRLPSGRLPTILPVT